jgi:dTMP kinase
MKRGIFIVIDGTDGVGKQTQTKMLVERLRQAGQRVETVSFPQYDRPACGAVKTYLSGEYGTAEEVSPYAASVLFAVDRFDAKRRITNWLDSGAIVIADRYVSSNMGHQGGKISDRDERLKFYRWEDEFEYGLLKLPRPDLSIILHAPAQTGMKQAADRDGSTTVDIHQGNLGHLQAAELAYLDLAATFPERFHLIECMPYGKMLPRDMIHELIWDETSKRLAQAGE